MGQQHSTELACTATGTTQAHEYGSASVDQELFGATGNERGWSGSVRIRQGAAGPEECDGKHVVFVTVLRTRQRSLMRTGTPTVLDDCVSDLKPTWSGQVVSHVWDT